MIGHYVPQGNDNGKAISKGMQNSFLYTQDLTPCIAVCIDSPGFYYMIHSEKNFGFINSLGLLLQRTEHQITTGDFTVTIHLLGGNSISSIEEKKQSISSVIPLHCIQWGYVEIDISNAFFGQGVIASKKFDFAMRLGRDPLTIKLRE